MMRPGTAPWTTVAIRANENATATPGTTCSVVPSSPRTSRSTNRAYMKVARNTPSVAWLRWSRRNVRSTRGENCRLANCSTITVTENTSAVSVRDEDAIAESSSRALSGPPLKPTRRSSSASRASSSTRAKATAAISSTIRSG